MDSPRHLPSPAALAACLDHTLLRPDACAADIERLCAQAVRHGFKAVCVNPWHLPLAVRCLRGTAVLPITVAGFPLGASQTLIKAREAGLAVEQGAAEVDMVLNIGALKDRELALVRQDMAEVVRACGPVLVKVILETCLLTDAEKELACRLAVDAGAGFVKTSTGFGPGGATEADVRLLRRVVGPDIGVKASGGVRTLGEALRMLDAGADRIGASASVQMIAELNTGGGA
ncbi:MAG: deoxyribose-phosphate aldolase [Proteobacteria bacterium]|nr:deoxyribose-phosphate aldolase [Pseudomonadota bacterium]MBU1596657.1 deoxyribose-phosphate aldolase [Pseudomonadota bacterium]